MRALSDFELLAAWENGHVAAHGLTGPLCLLAAAYPDESVDSLARLSIGRRDGLLLELREQLFGSMLVGLCDCVDCHQALEVRLETSSLKVPVYTEITEPLSLTSDGYQLNFRLPNSIDLMAISGAPSIASGRIQLLERLMISCSYHGEPVSACDLPEATLELVEDRLGAADPQGDIQLNLACVACEKHNRTLFDIASFLWNELDVWAIRMLREIHELARAYGWSEREIVTMSSWRRRCYLEMLGI